VNNNPGQTPDIDDFLRGFSEGYQQGFAQGFSQGFNAGFSAEQPRNQAQLPHMPSVPASLPVSSAMGFKGVEATVVSKEVLSPSMVRLRVSAPSLRGTRLAHTDSRIKIVLAPPGAQYTWPFDRSELKRTQPKHLMPVSRTYTVRSLDAETGEMDIDFFIHGTAGVAGPWASNVEPGEKFGFYGPKGKWRPDPYVQRCVFVGDESAAPAIAAGLEALPEKVAATVFLEVERPGHELSLPPNAQVHWVYREDRRPGMALADAAVRYTPSESSCQWFVRGESRMARLLREELLKVRRLDKKQVSCAGYWKSK